MKKLTSLIMSWLIVLQAGGFIRAEEQAKNLKFEPINDKSLASNAIINKKNSPAMMVGIAIGAGLIATLGAFGIYKFVTRNKDENKDENDIINKTLKQNKKTNLMELPDSELRQMIIPLTSCLFLYSPNKDPESQERVAKASEQLHKIYNELDRRNPQTAAPGTSQEQSSDLYLKNEEHENKTSQITSKPESDLGDENKIPQKIEVLGTDISEGLSSAPDTNKDSKSTATDQKTNPNLIDVTTPVIKEIVVWADKSKLEIKVNGKMGQNVPIRYEGDETNVPDQELDNYYTLNNNRFANTLMIFMYSPFGKSRVAVVAKIVMSEHTFNHGLCYSEVLKNIQFNVMSKSYSWQAVCDSEKSSCVKLKQCDFYDFSPGAHSKGDTDDACVNILIYPDLNIKAVDEVAEKQLKLFFENKDRKLTSDDVKQGKVNKLVVTYKDLKDKFKEFNLEPVTDGQIKMDSPIPEELKVRYIKPYERGEAVKYIIEEELQKKANLPSTITAKNLRELYIRLFLRDPNSDGSKLDTFTCNFGFGNEVIKGFNMAIRTSGGAIIPLYVDPVYFSTLLGLDTEQERRIFNTPECNSITVKDLVLVSKKEGIVVSFFTLLNEFKSLQSYTNELWWVIGNPFSGTLFDYVSLRLRNTGKAWGVDQLDDDVSHLVFSESFIKYFLKSNPKGDCRVIGFKFKNKTLTELESETKGENDKPLIINLAPDKSRH